VTGIGEREPRVAAARTPLSRQRVLAAAVELADAEGIEALSMRRLARALGVEAMSLYHHTKNKDDILAGIADRVIEEMTPPRPGGDWKAEIRASAISTRTVLQRHRWAADLLLSSARLQTAQSRSMEAVLGTLRAGGFEGELIDHAYHAVDIYTLGYALWESRFGRTVTRPLADLANEVRASLSVEEYPHLVEHIEWHMRPPSGPRVSTFEFGLDQILDGLERARDAGLVSARKA
jgi:AcrR family transcriptional regulator